MRTSTRATEDTAPRWSAVILMRAMVLAAGLGTRLRPLTYEITKPMVPVLDRPVMEHILDLVERYDFDGVIANLHYFPDTIREHFGDRISYRYEPELLGTAGGVRACADFFGDEPFLVISGDALTDIDLGSFVARHRESGGIATLAVKQVTDTREYGVVLHDRAGRITGFQEKPSPEEALSDLGNCGIYIFEPTIFDHFPDRPFVDWAKDVFPTLLQRDVPFHIHEVREYWNDVGSLGELRQGTFDALRGALRLQMEGTEISPGVTVVGDSPLREDTEIDGDAWIGRDVRIGSGVRLMGPIVLGDGARIGDGAQLRECIVFPGTEIAPGAILIGAIAGHGGILQSMRRRRG
ncbi:MAG: mannose-phosphate guanylyltransferase [Solirubrobacteraceae bacterium]|nr:mannose-phosphate guanylyltransferase [Solirubrobacteraceae bacterium]